LLPSSGGTAATEAASPATEAATETASAASAATAREAAATDPSRPAPAAARSHLRDPDNREYSEEDKEEGVHLRRRTLPPLVGLSASGRQ
jgi:hypothetical protein